MRKGMIWLAQGLTILASNLDFAEKSFEWLLAKVNEQKKIRQFTGEMGTSQYFKQGPEKKMFTLANNNNKKGNQYFFSFMKMAACR